MTSRMSYDNECLTITRRFDAPIEVIFEAWIETSKVLLYDNLKNICQFHIFIIIPRN